MTPHDVAQEIMTQHSVNIDDIQAAHQRIRHQVLETPLVESKALSALNNGRVFLKCENLQHTGSFKFRGGSNAVLSLTPEQRQNGVLAYSSGNHAQGVACAAALAGAKATIVMPKDAPAVKIANTRAHGADVVLYDRYNESREEIGSALAAETGAELIKPYDDVRVIAGQGTAGLECAHQAMGRDIQPDAMIVCCGGGGLSAGCGIAMTSVFPNITMYTAEPDDFDDFARSLGSGHRETNAPEAHSFCDAIVTPTPGEITFPLVQNNYQSGLSASDHQVREAIRLLFTHHRVIAEPGGAVAVASLMAHAKSFQGQTVVLMISGGNIDASLLNQIISEELTN